MVSKSPAWQSIAAQLGLSGHRSGVGRGERIGFDIAAELAAVRQHRDANREEQAAENPEAEVARLKADQESDDRCWKVPQKP